MNFSKVPKSSQQAPLFLLAAVLSLPAVANDAMGPALLDRIMITGGAAQVDRVPGSAHNITEEELDRFSFTDIHRTLRQVPGVNVQEEDGFGLFPNIGLRGTRLERNSRITVMEDGVLIAPAPYSAPAAYYFPQTGRMSGVEVRKGSAAIQYGPYTTGGAINLLSTPIPDEAAARAELLFGRFGGSRIHGWLGGSGEQFGWLAEAHTASSDGFKRLDPLPEQSPGPNAPEAGTGFDSENFLAKLRWRSPAQAGVYQELELKAGMDDRTADETYLGLTLDDYRADPFRRYRGSQLDRINTEHRQLELRHYLAPTANLDFATTVYYSEFARNWYKLNDVQNQPGGASIGISAILADPEQFAETFSWILGEGILGEGILGEGIPGEGGSGLLGTVRANNREYYSRGVQTRATLAFDTGAADHRLELGVRYHEDQEDRLQWDDSFRMVNGTMVLVRPGQEIGDEGGARNGIPGSSGNRVTDAEAWAFHLVDTIQLDRLTLTPGIRYEDFTLTRTDYFEGDNPNRDSIRRRRSNDTSKLLPGLGATYELTPETILLAGVHRGFAPTGPGTDAETSWNYEAGARYRSGSFRTSALGFLTRYDNLVGVCTAASGGGCEIGDEFDGGRVDVWGLEFEAGYDLGRGMDLGVGIPLSLAYTWTRSEFQTSFQSSFAEWGQVLKGDEMPQIPRHQLNLGIGLLWSDLGAFVNANYVSRSRAQAGSGPIPDDQRVDERILVDLAVEYRVHDNLRLFGSVENLFDESYRVAWRPAGARPGMPRTGWLGLKFDF